MAYEKHIDELVERVKKSVREAGKILAEHNPELADQWNRYPDRRREVARRYAAPFLQLRSSGFVSIPVTAQLVWGAAVDYVQTKALCPKSFDNR